MPARRLSLPASVDEMHCGGVGRKVREAVKKSPDDEKHSTQRREVVEGAMKTKQLLFASLCGLVSLLEIVCFFTASREGSSYPKARA